MPDLRPWIVPLDLKTVLSLAPLTSLTALAADPAKKAAAPRLAASKSIAPRSFETPGQAADALVAAARKDDVAALVEIFGSDGKSIVSSGDDVRDKNDRAWFVGKAKEKLDVSEDPFDPSRATLSIGEDAWPLPVPLVLESGKWHFNAKKGAREILARRIGGNELTVIEVCRGYVEAQKEYASADRDGSGVLQYAQRILSSPGKRDGLMWKNEDGSAGGPIGEVVAKAIAEGHTKRGEPYHGYFFKTLRKQGPAAPLGAMGYVIDGKMIGGFALVAWPAQYLVTGVQTFLVSHDGVVYQKDLGADTGKAAAAIDSFNPDKTWRPVEGGK